MYESESYIHLRFQLHRPVTKFGTATVTPLKNSDTDDTLIPDALVHLQLPCYQFLYLGLPYKITHLKKYALKLDRCFSETNCLILAIFIFERSMIVI